MRILLLQHVGSRYGVLKGMSEALYSAFIRQGIETTLFDAWDQGPSELLRCIDEWKPEYTFSINLFAHKELPFDSYGINHIVLCVDALSNYKGLNEGEIESKHLNCLFVDAYSSDLYKARGGRACWFPHAISEELLDEIQTKKVLPWTERPYEVVLLGSYIDPKEELMLWRNLFSKKQIDTLCSLAEELLEDASLSFQHTLLAFLNNNPSFCEILKKNSLSVFQFISSLESYMRGVDRKRLAQAFPGAHIHIFGEGWQPFPGCTIHPPVPFLSVFEVCTQAKVVVNSTPTIRRGYHERLFLGLASGALVVTSKADVPHLEQAKSLLQYTTSSLPHLHERVKNMEQLPPALEWLRKNHTWDVRIKNLRQQMVESEDPHK